MPTWHPCAPRQIPDAGLNAVVAAYRRVLDLDPDHTGARSAIAGLSSQWRQAVSAALIQGDLAQARACLEEAYQLSLAQHFPWQLSEICFRLGVITRRFRLVWNGYQPERVDEYIARAVDALMHTRQPWQPRLRDTGGKVPDVRSATAFSPVA